MPTPLRLAFAGTPDFAARHLEHLLNGPHRLAAVLTQPDRPAGRGKQLRPSPVKRLAMEANLPLWQPETLKTTDAERVQMDAVINHLLGVQMLHRMFVAADVPAQARKQADRLGWRVLMPV